MLLFKEHQLGAEDTFSLSCPKMELISQIDKFGNF